MWRLPCTPCTRACTYVEAGLSRNTYHTLSLTTRTPTIPTLACTDRHRTDTGTEYCTQVLQPLVLGQGNAPAPHSNDIGEAPTPTTHTHAYTPTHPLTHHPQTCVHTPKHPHTNTSTKTHIRTPTHPHTNTSTKKHIRTPTYTPLTPCTHRTPSHPVNYSTPNHARLPRLCPSETTIRCD